MTKEEFRKAVTGEIEAYIENWDRFGHDPELRVNPADLELRIFTRADLARAVEDSDEVIENAAIAQGAATEEAEDRQATQNPDFYPLRTLIKASGERTIPDPLAIDRLVRRYF